MKKPLDQEVLHEFVRMLDKTLGLHYDESQFEFLIKNLQQKAERLDLQVKRGRDRLFI